MFKLLNNISWIMLAKVYSIFIGFFSSILIIRYFEPELNGIYNYVIAYVTIFNGIALMGIENVLTKELSRNKWNVGAILTSSFVVRFIGTIIAFGILIASLIIKRMDLNKNILIMISALPFIVNIFSGIGGWFLANDKAKQMAMSQAMSHTICIFLRIILVVMEASIWSFIIVTTLETYILITIEWLFFLYNNREINIEWKPKVEIVLYLLKQGVPVILGSIANTIFMRIDQVMIGDMLGNYELGIYSVAVRIAELWYFIPTTIVSVIIPYLTRLNLNRNKHEFENQMQKVMSWLVLIGYLSGIGIVIIGKPIIHIMYGEKYLASFPILCIYIWAGIFINMSVLRGAYFVIKEVTKYSFWCNLLGAIVNIGLNLILIPRMGNIGAAFATLISYFMYAFASSFLIKDLKSIGYIQTKALLLIGIRGKINGRKN